MTSKLPKRGTGLPACQNGQDDTAPLARHSVSLQPSSLPGSQPQSRSVVRVFFRTLRLQLTAWYLAFFSVLFLLFCFLLYGTLARALERRLDEKLASEATTAAALMREELDEMNGDGPRAALDVLSEMQPGASVIAILQRTEVLAASRPIADRELHAQAAEFLLAPSADAVWSLPRWGKNGARGAAHQFTRAGRAYIAVAVEPLDSIIQQLRVLREALWFTLPPLLALAGLGGYLLTRRGLAPLGVMVEQSRKITGESLNTRLEVGDAAEELNTLAVSFNELLSRLDQSFDGMRRFVQDASHEIRTPLAVIRGEADVALANDRSPAEYKESLAVIQEESRRLSRLVEDLLNLARADAGHVQLQVQQLYLNDLLADCCRSLQPLATARNIHLECRVPEDVAVEGDEELLRRMIWNLIDNAIRYTPAGGKVAAAIETDGPNVRIRVADNGVGIAPEAAGHIFERFYRVDQARSREHKPETLAGGFGLGLSIVKWIADAHHAAVELTSQPGAGSTFTVRLPRA
jgi:heavy metal sensor kinase